jgi:hypothetical protein
MKPARTKQCRNCPWRKDSDLSKITGYSRDQHYGLESTIAKEGDFNIAKLKIMACHESTESTPEHCIGWVHNQLGVGNNIGLRIAMARGDFTDIEVFGEQFKTFEETLR